MAGGSLPWALSVGCTFPLSGQFQTTDLLLPRRLLADSHTRQDSREFTSPLQGGKRGLIWPFFLITTKKEVTLLC
jgi:hypothetical protein